jgi:hypothetical protein
MPSRLWSELPKMSTRSALAPLTCGLLRLLWGTHDSKQSLPWPTREMARLYAHKANRCNFSSVTACRLSRCAVRYRLVGDTWILVHLVAYGTTRATLALRRSLLRLLRDTHDPHQPLASPTRKTAQLCAWKFHQRTVAAKGQAGRGGMLRGNW